MKKSRTRNRNSVLRVPHGRAEVFDKALTQQQFRDECDINRIVKNATRGIAPRFQARGVPQYGDFSQVPDLMGAYELVQRAEAAFMNLPAELRLELDNDPANINQLTQEQVIRFKLGKEAPPSQLPPPAPGQGATGGTEPPEAPQAPSAPAPKGGKG